MATVMPSRRKNPEQQLQPADFSEAVEIELPHEEEEPSALANLQSAFEQADSSC
jgi:hypothetical protein